MPIVCNVFLVGRSLIAPSSAGCAHDHADGSECHEPHTYHTHHSHPQPPPDLSPVGVSASQEDPAAAKQRQQQLHARFGQVLRSKVAPFAVALCCRSLEH